MKKSTRRLIGGLTVAAGALATYLVKKRNRMGAKQQRVAPNPLSVWARPGMKVTFRAELMPGRERESRTFKIKELLPSGRVILDGFSGEHTEKEFEPTQ